MSFWKKIFGTKQKSKTMLDELNDIIDENPVLKLQKEYFNSMNKNGTSQDTIPEGFGRFAYDVTNPIPTNNIFGSYGYLGRLRDSNDNPIKYSRLGSTSAPNLANPIDIYEITDSKGNGLGTIYISPYHKKNSNIAPEGFKII